MEGVSLGGSSSATTAAAPSGVVAAAPLLSVGQPAPVTIATSHFDCTLKRHGPFVAFNFYCKILLISISYNYCSVLTANKCFIETELTL